MKKIICLILITMLGVFYVYGNHLLKTNIQNEIKYNFGGHEISKRRYIQNIRSNVQNYLDYKRNNGWSGYWVEEFINAYHIYIDALDDPKNPYRFRTDEFGTLIDNSGILGNNDFDDYWYDKKGNRITGAEYQRLKGKKKKKYVNFEANRSIAYYFNIIGKEVVKLEQKHKEGTKHKSTNNNSEYIGW